MNENGVRSPARRKGNASMRLLKKGAGDDDLCASESTDKQRRDDRERLSNTKMKRTNREATTLQRWFLLITIIVVFRTVIYNSFILSDQIGEYNLDFPREGLHLHRKPKYSRRKRPPPPRRMTPEDSPRYSLATSESSQVVLSLPDDLTPSSRTICGVHNNKSSSFPILSTSRILILGILSHPLGVELALTLAQTCGVQSIVGLADNNIDEEIPPRLASLLRTLPDIQIHRIPAPLTQDHLKEVFASSTFTHIVHLDTLPFSSNIFREDTPPIFGIRDNIHTLDHIFKAVVTHRSHSNSIEEPHLVYVTTTSSSSLEHYTVNSQLLQQTSNSMFHVLAPTFRSLYRVHATHLKLPYVYGPFQDGATWMTSRFGRATPKSTEPDAFLQDDTRWIHVTDAIQAITSSMSTGFRSQPESLVDSHLIVPKDRTTTLKKLEHAMKELLAGKVKLKEREYDNLQFMLAWNYKKEHPFGANATSQSTGSPATDAAMHFTNSHLSLEHKQTNGISSLQRRQNKLFPCISECGNVSPCQRHSAFDSVVPVSHRATRECRFALYTVDFSRTLKELHQVKETPQGSESVIWPNHTMCQIAFVSGKSKLVTSLLDKKKKINSSDHQTHTADYNSDYNGQLVHNGWTLVWVEHDDADTLSEADYMMPKVAPGGLFSSNITRAFYFEPTSFKSFPPLVVIWNLLRKQLDDKSKENVRETDTRGRQVIIPYIPGRLVALFIHSLWLPDSFESNSSFDTLARHILKQKGLDSDRPWPRRQLDFYSHVFGMTHGDFPFEWVDTGLIIHNLQARKSRLLRCEWYQEHLFWSSDSNRDDDHAPHGNPNRHFEDLSLAYIIGKWRNGGQLVDEEETRKWGERVLETGDLVKEQEQQAQLGPDYRAPRQYFLRLFKPVKARVLFE